MGARHIVRRWILGTLILLCAMLVFLKREDILGLFLSLEALKETAPLLTACILIVCKMLAGPLGFPGAPLTVLTGSLFGVWWGTVIALIGNTLGALFAFVLARYLLQTYVREKIVTRYPQVDRYITRIERVPYPTIIALRLIPLIPFNALNFVFGITRIRISTYVIGSAVGMIPGTFAFVYLGGALRVTDPITILSAILGIALLVVFGRWYERQYTKTLDM